MRMRFLAGPALVMMLLLSAKGADPKPILVSVGEEFEIVLDSPAAGADRHWLLSKPLDESRVKQLGREYRKAPVTNSRPRTCEVLRYQAVSKGKAEVHLKFASLFEENAKASRTTNFVVVIEQAAPKPAK